MSIFELAADQLFQECRRACYHALATHGYSNPDLYLERKDGDYYMSYWGSGNKRMEAFYDLNTDCVSIYELKFVSPSISQIVQTFKQSMRQLEQNTAM